MNWLLEHTELSLIFGIVIVLAGLFGYMIILAVKGTPEVSELNGWGKPIGKVEQIQRTGDSVIATIKLDKELSPKEMEQLKAWSFDHELTMGFIVKEGEAEDGH
jgi:hypothetical protein